MLNVSVPSIKRAKVVQEQATPELIAAVESGEVAVSAAAEIATLPQQNKKNWSPVVRKRFLQLPKRTRRDNTGTSGRKKSPQ